MAHPESSLTAWIAEANRLMIDTYCIDFEDIGAAETDLARFFEAFPVASEFVSWFGEKYDLDERRQWPYGLA
jgi:hypothetical protein